MENQPAKPGIKTPTYRPRPATHVRSNPARAQRTRRSYTWAVVAVPLVTILTTVAVFLIVPTGHEGVEGGPVDHNWGGHAWAHATVASALAFCAYYIFVNRKADTLGAAWRTNPYAVLAWCAIAWGAAGFFLDGILTAFVGDDTTWTHAFGLQAALQFPFMFGILIFGALAGIRRMSLRRRATTPQRVPTRA